MNPLPILAFRSAKERIDLSIPIFTSDHRTTAKRCNASPDPDSRVLPPRPPSDPVSAFPSLPFVLFVLSVVKNLPAVPND
jgi:hypothetical protein